MNADFEVPAEVPAGISGGGRRLLDLLAELPLATTRDLTALAGVSSSATYKRLGELRDLGLLGSASLGWCGSLSMRWFLTDMALSVLSRLGITWHQEFSRCRLLERLPSVEWFYQVVSQIEDLGSFEAFHWMNGVSLDAVVRYQHGWVALFWSGSFQSEDWIASRLGRLAQDLRDLSVSLEAPWPGLLAFVVSDEWQRELVYRAARRYYLEDQVAVWCARDGSRSGARNCRASRGWVYQPVYFGDTGGWGWERRLEVSPWVEKRGQSLGRVLDIVSQWPGMVLEMARQALDEGSKGKSAQNSCKGLYDLGFVDRLWHGGKYRYMTTPKGVDCISRRDRVHYSQCTDRVDSLSWVNKPSLRAHEDGIMSCIGHFLDRGLPVAAGWRSWEQLKASGISPDGMVFLERSPYGPTWAYFEYERTARGEARVGRKLTGYGSADRGDGWPVLFVCWNDDAESVFQRLGNGMGIPLLTTTIKRLEEYGPLDNFGCWSMYGQPALIG